MSSTSMAAVAAVLMAMAGSSWWILFSLSSLEFRPSRLREGANAFLVVLAVEAVGDQPVEHGQIARGRGPQQLRHRGLGRAHRQRSVAADLVCVLAREGL